MTKKKPYEGIVVEVCRESSDGQIYSQVRREPKPCCGNAVVIDRTRGRGLDIKTVKFRAKALADLLGVPYVEDFEWRCQAAKKLACKCPGCVAEGRV
jgi:hypothetical protein